MTHNYSLLNVCGELSRLQETTMSKLRIRLSIVGALCLGAILGFSHSAAAQEGVTATSVRLGQSLALSGPAAALGTDYQRGAMLYFDKLNAQGGINGRTIELVTMDDAYDPAKAAANTETLINDKDVFALFGYVGTPTSAASLSLATKAKVPFFAPFSGAAILREPFNRYAIHLRAGYNEETAKIVQQLVTVGMKRIAVFHQNDSYGQAGLNGVLKAMEPLQIKPIAVATVERNSTDVAKAVTELMATKPDAIVQISAYASSAAFIKEARKAGYGGQFYNVSFVGTEALGKALGKEARGVVISQVMPYLNSRAPGVMDEYQNAAKAASVEGNYTKLEGYIAAKTFAEALRRAGRELSRERFITAVESIRDWNLGVMSLDYGPKDHIGSKFVELTLLNEDGKVIR
jgi:branched-chain amino acid transport system substrate-binding protein